MLEVKELHKAYGKLNAVSGISFRIGRGETVGLLGPNGAGKTTAIAMICGLTRPDNGSVLLDGKQVTHDADLLKLRVGLVPQDLALFDELTAWANLELFAGLYALAPITLNERGAAALTLVGLADRRNAKVKTFSGGMKRRLNIAAALLHDPDLLLLDEPTVGVDPQSRNAIFENLEALKKQGKTLLYTTHYMEEAERLCDRIVIMDHGRVIADDTPDGLRRRLAQQQQVRVALDGSPASEALVQELSARFGAKVTRSDSNASLEEVFMHLTGRALRDAASEEQTNG
jgi:ABC-2 type transport system ATP-binding protein